MLTEIMDRTAFYIVPVVNPDSRVYWFEEVSSPNTSRGNKRPIDSDRDGLFAEDPPNDLDGDGSLTIFDFLAFQNLFDSGDPAADFDGDGVLTIFDFTTFLNEFDAGCS